MQSRLVPGPDMRMQTPIGHGCHHTHAASVLQSMMASRMGVHHQHPWAPAPRCCHHQALRQRTTAQSASSDNWKAAWSSQDSGSGSDGEGAGPPPSRPGRVFGQGSAQFDSMMQPMPSPLTARPQTQPPTGPDQLAAFKAFQQLAPLQEGGPALSTGPIRTPRNSSGTTRVQSLQQTLPYPGGRPGADAEWRRSRDGGGRQDRDGSPGAHLSMFRKSTKNMVKQGWYAESSLTVQELYEDICAKAAHTCPGPAPLFLLLRKATCAEHMRTALSACVLVRSAQARYNEELRPVGGPRLAVAFAQACVRCDAPDVLASALTCANEAGLVLSYAAVFEALKHWAQTHEMHKVLQVVQAMQAGGLPYTTRTAYIVVRGAVNAGRMDMAEQMVQMFQEHGVRLHDTTLRLLELGRQRAQARQQALQSITGGGAAAAGPQSV